MTRTFDFPGGSVAIDNAEIERKLADKLEHEGARELSVRHAHGRWSVTLVTDHGFQYSAGSELGLLDAIANALQAAYGSEEVL